MANGTTINYSTENASAIAGFDYTAVNGSFVYEGSTYSVTVNTLDDNGTGEGMQDMGLSASTSNVSSTGIGWITEDDESVPQVPQFNIADASTTEGSGPLVFTVTISPTTDYAYVYYGTTDGEGASAAVSPEDYGARSGVLNFQAGQSTQTITVPVASDPWVPSAETMFVVLSDAQGAVIGRGIATGTIKQGPAPTVSIGDASAPEGSSVTFPIVLSATDAQAVTGTFSTSDGSATAPEDYTSTVANFTIPAGSLSTTVSVPTAADLFSGSDETFTASLSNVTPVQVSRATAVGTIIEPTLSIADASALESSGGMTFTVTLSPANTLQTATAGYTTVDGEDLNAATAPPDYTPTTGTLTFPPGVTSQTIFVPLLPDAAGERRRRLGQRRVPLGVQRHLGQRGRGAPLVRLDCQRRHRHRALGLPGEHQGHRHHPTWRRHCHHYGPHQRRQPLRRTERNADGRFFQCQQRHAPIGPGHRHDRRRRRRSSHRQHRRRLRPRIVG